MWARKCLRQTKMAKKKLVAVLIVAAAAAALVALVLALKCRKCGGEAAPAEPQAPTTVEEEVAQRMADPVYRAQLDELHAAQNEVLAKRAQIAARLEDYTRGKTPAEYEGDAEFQSLKRRFDDLDRAVEAERQRALQVIRTQISK